MRIPKEEQETIINFNAKNKIATVYTRDPTFMKQMDKLVSEYPDTFRCKYVSEVDRVYEVTAASVTFRKPRRLTNEQREAARKRIKSIVYPDMV
jgi:hypothetical protein